MRSASGSRTRQYLRRSVRLASLVLGLLLLPASQAFSMAALTPRQVEEKVALGLVKIETDCGQGTGFLIGGQVLVTATHVLEDNGQSCSSAVVTQEDTGATAAITGHVSWYTETPGDDTDFSVAFLDTSLSGYYFNLRRTAVRNNETVLALGYAGGLDLSRTSGRVTTSTDSYGVPVLILKQLNNWGGSGGPILDLAGQVVGLTQRGDATRVTIFTLDLVRWTQGNPQSLCKGSVARYTSTLCTATSGGAGTGATTTTLQSPSGSSSRGVGFQCWFQETGGSWSAVDAAKKLFEVPHASLEGHEVNYWFVLRSNQPRQWAGKLTITTPNGSTWITGTGIDDGKLYTGLHWNADAKGNVRYWNAKKYDYGYGLYVGGYESLLLQWHDPVTRNYMGDGDWIWSFTASDGQTCSNATKVRF